MQRGRIVRVPLRRGLAEVGHLLVHGALEVHARHVLAAAPVAAATARGRSAGLDRRLALQLDIGRAHERLRLVLARVPAHLVDLRAELVWRIFFSILDVFHYIYISARVKS